MNGRARGEEEGGKIKTRGREREREAGRDWYRQCQLPSPRSGHFLFSLRRRRRCAALSLSLSAPLFHRPFLLLLLRRAAADAAAVLHRAPRCVIIMIIIIFITLFRGFSLFFAPATYVYTARAPASICRVEREREREKNLEYIRGGEREYSGNRRI